jgi:hypothetical protein
MTRFDFYLLNKSFQYQEGITLDTLRQRIEIMADDCAQMRSHGDSIYRNNDIYDVTIFKDLEIGSELKIQDVIWPHTEVLTRDQRNALQLIIDHATESPLTDQDIIELLPLHDHEIVSGLLTLHEINSVSSKFLVYIRNDWFNFHRDFLGLYPISENYFHLECAKYFPKVYLHDRVKESLSTFDGGFENFTIITIRCLTALNDKLANHYSNETIKTLKSFSSECGIETTNEGDKNRKSNFTFKFPLNNRNEVSVCCEPHMKISRSDNSSDNHFYHNRLYFHFPKSDVCNGKILVGHIGSHL